MYRNLRNHRKKVKVKKNKVMTDEQRKQYRKEYKQKWYQDNRQKVLAKEKDPARIQYKKEYYLKNKGIASCKK